MTTRELIAWANERLQAAGCDTPRLDAEILLMHAWHIDRPQLIIRMHQSPSEEIAQHFKEMVARRKSREPVAYIVGEKEFWSREFTVTPDVLIPRPETEHLIEAALRCLPDRNGDYRFCDIGTGSGCIAVTLACEFPQSRVLMTDISERALAVAQGNAIRHGVDSRIEARVGDIFSPLKKGESFDLIISNPPYVSREESEDLEPELAFEPGNALTDGGNGLRYLRTLTEEAIAWLKPDAYLIVETGLCGLPPTPPDMQLTEKIIDLAGLLRGGIYRHRSH